MRRPLAVTAAMLLVLGLDVAARAAAVTPCFRGTVALTFDDGPRATYVPKVLDVSRRATSGRRFFEVGTQVAAQPSLPRCAHRECHWIADHTNRHDRLTSLTSRAIRDSSGGPTDRSWRPVPHGPHWCAPRTGDEKPRGVMSDLEMHQVLWTIDPRDWRKSRSPSTITRLRLDGLQHPAAR